MALWWDGNKAEPNPFKDLLGYGLKQTSPPTHIYSLWGEKKIKCYLDSEVIELLV